MLKSASWHIKLSAQYKGRVEEGVIDYLSSQGYRAWHTENYIWRGIFGLLFWEIIFDNTTGAMHHPLQRQPSDFHSPDFLNYRRKALEDRLAEVGSTENAFNEIAEAFGKYEGVANPMVVWHPALLVMAKLYCQFLPWQGLASVLLAIAQNPGEAGKGFPDLFACQPEGEYFFAEVKSATDQLSAQQYFWLDFFEKNGLKVYIIRTQWTDFS